jgi:hypothetical protein
MAAHLVWKPSKRKGGNVAHLRFWFGDRKFFRSLKTTDETVDLPCQPWHGRRQSRLPGEVPAGAARLDALLGLVKEVGGLKKFKDLLAAMSVSATDQIPF